VRHIKIFLKQILSGLNICHSNRIIHRDIKPQNILIGIDENLKLADFGLARGLSVPGLPLTKEVVTLWYRAPELLLEATQYSFPVDMWSVGCIFWEICTFRPLFNGLEEILMIKMIF
jgi:serine/threonine protein kinase